MADPEKSAKDLYSEHRVLIENNLSENTDEFEKAGVIVRRIDKLMDEEYERLQTEAEREEYKAQEWYEEFDKRSLTYFVFEDKQLDKTIIKAPFVVKYAKNADGIIDEEITINQNINLNGNVEVVDGDYLSAIPALREANFGKPLKRIYYLEPGGQTPGLVKIGDANLHHAVKSINKSKQFFISFDDTEPKVKFSPKLDELGAELFFAFGDKDRKRYNEIVKIFEDLGYDDHISLQYNWAQAVGQLLTKKLTGDELTELAKALNMEGENKIDKIEEARKIELEQAKLLITAYPYWKDKDWPPKSQKTLSEFVEGLPSTIALKNGTSIKGVNPLDIRQEYRSGVMRKLDENPMGHYQLISWNHDLHIGFQGFDRDKDYTAKFFQPPSNGEELATVELKHESHSKIVDGVRVTYQGANFSKDIEEFAVQIFEEETSVTDRITFKPVKRIAYTGMKQRKPMYSERGGGEDGGVDLIIPPNTQIIVLNELKSGEDGIKWLQVEYPNSPGKSTTGWIIANGVREPTAEELTKANAPLGAAASHFLPWAKQEEEAAAAFGQRVVDDGVAAPSGAAADAAGAAAALDTWSRIGTTGSVKRIAYANPPTVMMRGSDPRLPSSDVPGTGSFPPLVFTEETKIIIHEEYKSKKTGVHLLHVRVPSTVPGTHWPAGWINLTKFTNSVREPTDEESAKAKQEEDAAKAKQVSATENPGGEDEDTDTKVYQNAWIDSITNNGFSPEQVTAQSVGGGSNIKKTKNKKFRKFKKKRGERVIPTLKRYKIKRKKVSDIKTRNKKTDIKRNKKKLNKKELNIKTIKK